MEADFASLKVERQRFRKSQQRAICVFMGEKTKIRTYIFTVPCTTTIQIFQVFPDSPSINNEERQPKTGQMFALLYIHILPIQG